MKKNFRNWIFSTLKSVGCISVQFSIIWHQRHCNYLHIRSVFLWWIINMSGHHLFIFTTRSDKYWLQVELVCMFVKRGDTQPANSFSTTALKMCNCGLKVKLKIFIILHPSWCDRQTGQGWALACKFSELGKYLDTAQAEWGQPQAPASHISIVSGIIIKFQITSYQGRCQEVKSLAAQQCRYRDSKRQ